MDVIRLPLFGRPERTFACPLPLQPPQSQRRAPRPAFPPISEWPRLIHGRAVRPTLRAAHRQANPSLNNNPLTWFPPHKTHTSTQHSKRRSSTMKTCRCSSP